MVVMSAQWHTQSGSDSRGDATYRRCDELRGWWIRG